MWQMLRRWLLLQWRLTFAYDVREELRLRVDYWRECGYAPAESTLLVLAYVSPSPYEQLLSHEAWCRRWHREGLIADELWRSIRLQLADQWMRTYEA